MEDQTVVNSEVSNSVYGQKIFDNSQTVTLVMSVLAIATSFYLMRRWTRGGNIKVSNKVIETNSEEME